MSSVCSSDIITASLSKKIDKLEPLTRVRTSLEILKHLVRIEYELKIIDIKTYVHVERLLVETSKMTNGWILYITRNPAI